MALLDKSKIIKPSTIITSLGRTGTKFFYVLLSSILTDATVMHEPDYLNFGQYRGHLERFREVIKQIQASGFSNLIIKKSLGRWDLVKLSDARLLDSLGHYEVVKNILIQRKTFIYSQRGEIYVESSSAYRGLIDVLPDVFRNHRVIYIIRDGRDWTQSKMNFGTMYDKGFLRRIVSHTWPTALDIDGDPYRARWQTMSRFEKICWAWARLNGYALDTIEQNPHARLFYFEDIFKSEQRYHHLADLVEFATSFPQVETPPAAALDGWLERRVHQSQAHFPAWPDWPPEYKQQFTEICGPLMNRLGYQLDE